MICSYKIHRFFASFFSAILLGLAALSFSSCEMFRFDGLNENETEQTPGSISPGKNTLTLNVALSQDQRSRNAYPDLATELSSLYCTIDSSEFEETQGTYSSGLFTFEIPCPTFSNKTITLYVKDNDESHSPNILLTGTATISYSTVGSTVNTTVYLTPYETTDENGSISLSISTSSGYSVACEVYDLEDNPVSGSGNPVAVTVSGQTTELSTPSGIAPGNYKANIYVYKLKGGSVDTSVIYEFAVQDIYVWPSMTTNKWYLANGSQNSNYTIPVNSNEIKYYVRGSGTCYGIYTLTDLSEVTGSDSDTTTGSIRNPFATIQYAVNKCLDENVSYRIIADGTFKESTGQDMAISIGNALGGGTTQTSKSNITVIGAGGNSSEQTKVKNIRCFTEKKVSFENFKMNSISGTPSGIQIKSQADNAEVTVTNCTIGYFQRQAPGAGISISGSKCKVTINDCNISNNRACSSTEANYGGGLYSSATGAEIILNNTVLQNNTVVGPTLISGGAVYIADTATNLIIKGSTYIPDDADGLHTIYCAAGSKITVDGSLTPPAAASGIVAHVIIDYTNIGDQVIYAQNGANLATESQRFTYAEHPLKISTAGKIAKQSQDLYVSSTGNNDTGDGSSAKPYSSVTRAVAKLKKISASGNCKITVSGVITDNVTLSTGTDSSATLGDFASSELTITGSNRSSDKIDGDANGSVIKVSGSHAKIKFENLTIQNGSAENGGGLFLDSSTYVTLKNVVVTACEAIGDTETTGCGGGIYNKGELYINGGTLIGNSVSTAPTARADAGNYAANMGGGICNLGGQVRIGYYDIYDEEPDDEALSQICGNYAAVKGGGAYIKNGSLVMHRGEVLYNYAVSSGGGLVSVDEINNNYSYFDNGSIKGNKTSGNGGGLSIETAASVTFASVTVEDNICGSSSQGGAVYMNENTRLLLDEAVYIPAGADGKHDVCFGGNCTVNIAYHSGLTPPSGVTCVATITPNTYTPDTTVIMYSGFDDGAGALGYRQYLAITDNDTSDDITWYIKADGKLGQAPYSVATAISNISAATGTTNPITIAGPVTAEELTQIKNALKSLSSSTRVQLDMSEAQITQLPASAFYQCRALSEIILPEGLTAIQANAFSSCSNLASVSLPSTIQSFGQTIFYLCPADIQVPDDVTAFTKSGDALYSNDGKTLVLYLNRSTESTFEVPNTVETIGDSAFTSSKLESISFQTPASVTTIGEMGFYSCTKLTNIVIPDSVTEIKRYALSSCALTTVTLSSNITTISDSMFSGCSALNNVVIPDGVTKIKQNAFWNCSGVTTITLPASLESIGFMALTGCKNIVTVNYKGSEAQRDLISIDSETYTASGYTYTHETLLNANWVYNYTGD